VPIIPVTYLNNWKLLPDSGRGIGHPGVSKIIVHAPIETKGMKEENLDALKQKVYEVIEAPLKEKYPQYFLFNN